MFAMAWVTLVSTLLGLVQEMPKVEALRPFQFFVGTWAGEGRMATGEAYVDEHRFEWIHGGAFLRAEYSLYVGGKLRYSATSIIGFDPEKKILVAHVFGGNGQIARSECTAAAKDRWVFEERVATGTGIHEGRVTQARVDDDTFSAKIEVKKDGEYVTTASYAYKRKK